MKIEIDIKFKESYNANININENYMKQFITKIIENHLVNKKINECYVSIYFTNNKEIHVLNKKYRKKDYTTDVLSFVYEDINNLEESQIVILGDIIISLEKTKAQALEYLNSFSEELYFLLTHGILHLLGYDHINDEEKIKMRNIEKQFMEVWHSENK